MTQKICMSKSYFLSVVQALMGHVAIIAAILMGHVPIAHSANWEFKYSTRDGRAFHDTDSYRKEGDLFSYWIKHNFVTGERKGISVAQFYIMNCQTMTYTMKHAVLYAEPDLKGRIMQFERDMPPKWLPIKPGTNNFPTYKKHCQLEPTGREPLKPIQSANVAAVTCSDYLNRNDTQDNARRTEKLESTFKRMQNIGWIEKSDSIKSCNVTSTRGNFLNDVTSFDTRAGLAVFVNMRKNTASLMRPSGGLERLCLDMDLGTIWRTTMPTGCW